MLKGHDNEIILSVILHKWALPVSLSLLIGNFSTLSLNSRRYSKFYTSLFVHQRVVVLRVRILFSHGRPFQGNIFILIYFTFLRYSNDRFQKYSESFHFLRLKIDENLTAVVVYYVVVVDTLTLLVALCDGFSSASGCLSGRLSDRHYGRLTGRLSGRLSDRLSDSLSGRLSGRLPVTVSLSASL